MSTEECDESFLTPARRFEILKTELSLIQATLDKYDDLIFRGRNFFITLWLASLSVAFTIKSDTVPLLAVWLSVVYWFLEGMMRHQYWYKYVDRYRFLRNQLNLSSNLDTVSVYDLTNYFHRKADSSLKRIRACFFKKEPTLLYLVMGASAFAIWWFVKTGALTFNS